MVYYISSWLFPKLLSYRKVVVEKFWRETKNTLDDQKN